MKKEDLNKSFDNIEPDEIAMERMLNNVLSHFKKKEEVKFLKVFKSFKLKKAVPVFAMAFVVAVSLLVFNLMPDNVKNLTKSNVKDYNNEYNTKHNSGNSSSPSNNGSSLSDNVSDSNASIANGNEGPTIESGRQGASDSIAWMPEDAVAKVINQFQIDNKHYIIMTDSQKAEFKLPDEVVASDIGRMLTTVTTSVDADLIGSEIYEYKPANCDAVVAVKINNEYKLFKFFNFDSYNNNQDEDVSAYLKLYGINSASDIAKIQLIGYSEQAKIERRLDIINEITDEDSITRFYNFYSVIKNSSDKYFEKLFNYNVTNSVPNNAPNDVSNNVQMPVPPEIMMEPSSSAANANSSVASSSAESNAVSDGTASSPGYVGSAAGALSNSFIIRIYCQSGVYFEAPYYPNIGFISRHEVSEEFASFFRELVK